MTDTETFGKHPGCALRSIGGVAFLPDSIGILGEFYVNIDRASCEAAGLVVDPDTEDWWNEPIRAEAQAAFSVDPRPLGEALDRFDSFYRTWTTEKNDRLWSNGPSFDEAILSAAYRALGREPPWRYNAGRDCRTIYDLAQVKLQHTEGTFHHALDDAREQALLVQRGLMLVRLSGSPPKNAV